MNSFEFPESLTPPRATTNGTLQLFWQRLRYSQVVGIKSLSPTWIRNGFQREAELLEHGGTQARGRDTTIDPDPRTHFDEFFKNTYKLYQN